MICLFKECNYTLKALFLKQVSRERMCHLIIMVTEMKAYKVKIIDKPRK